MGEATESSRLLDEHPRTSRVRRVIRDFLGLEIAMSVMAGAQAIHGIIVTNLYLDKVGELKDDLIYCVGVSSEPGSSSCCVLGPEQSPASDSSGPVGCLSPGAVQQSTGRAALSTHLHRAGCLVEHSSWLE